MKVGSPVRSRLFALLLAVVQLAVLIEPSLAADDPDGIYKVTRLSGATYVEGDKFDFPPQPILAAALGNKIIVDHGRIQRNDRARDEISRMIVQNQRLLDQVFSFHLWARPRFSQFKKSADGVLRAHTVSPLIIEISLKHDDELTVVTAWADYRAEIIGNKIVFKVKFYGRGGYYRGDLEEYDVKGHARILASRKHALSPRITALESDGAPAMNDGNSRKMPSRSFTMGSFNYWQQD